METDASNRSNSRVRAGAVELVERGAEPIGELFDDRRFGRGLHLVPGERLPCRLGCRHPVADQPGHPTYPALVRGGVEAEPSG